MTQKFARLLLVAAVFAAAAPAGALALTTIAPISGASTTYTNSQDGQVILRSCGGCPAMLDYLPAPALSNGTVIEFRNDETSPSSALEYRAAAGVSLDGVSGGYGLLGSGQAARIISDGTSYRRLSVPQRAKIANATLFINPAGAITNSGLAADRPIPRMQDGWDYTYKYLDLNNGGITYKLSKGTPSAPTIHDGLVATYTTPGWNTYGVPFVLVDGDVNDAASVVIGPTDKNGIFTSTGAYVYVRGTTITCPSGLSALSASFYSFITTLESMIFGACPNGAHFRADTYSYLNITKNYKVTGGGGNIIHMASSVHGRILKNGDVDTNITTPLSFYSFIYAVDFARIGYYGTTSGSAVTGVKAYSYDNAIVHGMLPGTITSTPSSGGQILP